jgi:hypothetical protein
MTKLGVSRFRDSIKEKQAVPRQGLMRVHFVTLKEKQAVRRQRVHFVTLKMNQAVRRQSLERVASVTLEKRTKRSEDKAWNESLS